MNGSTMPSQDNPFRVLGVAMIVDHRGIGSRLVARYPTQPPAVVAPTASQEKFYRSLDDDLFFNLTAHQLAKLFRTNKSLCGSPMTLGVNGTIFCCQAAVMQTDETSEETEASNENDQSQLVSFSVIVAMCPSMRHASDPFSSWQETALEDQLDLQTYLKEATAAASSPHTDQAKKNTNGRVSSAYLSIRRVHISLSRYCRVLQREEKRCHYVSLQVNQVFNIRNERQKKFDEQKASSSSTGAKQSASATSATTSVISNSSGPTSNERRPRHRPTSSYGTGLEDFLSQGGQDASEDSCREQEQEILELLLAAPPPETPGRVQLQHGNLVRELVQVFHSLSRNDHEYPPTPEALLIERDGVVYVNQHVAIPVEAASLRPSQSLDGPNVRPYYTLLFPHASPSALLQAFQSSGSSAPQRLQQLLLTVNPQKPLSEIAIDANLPLYTVLEMASYLVSHGACVASPVVSRKSRLACLQVDKIAELALEFSTLYANVHLFRLVAFLTSKRTLGEAMSALTNIESDECSWLRDCIAPAGVVRQDLAIGLVPPEEKSPVGTPGQPEKQESPNRWYDEMEELLFAMTKWLLSHRVLAQLQEYLVVSERDETTTLPSIPTMPTMTTAALDADENLFRELLESELLRGDISIMALSWRLGLDQQKLRSWGTRYKKIRVVSRVPTTGDDRDP